MRKLCAVLMMLALAAPAFAQTQIANGQRIVQRQVGVVKIVTAGGDTILQNVYTAGNPTSTIVGGVYYVDSTGRAISVDVNGVQQFVNINPPMDNTMTRQVIGPDILSSNTGVDSSLVVDVHQFAYLKAVYVVTPMDSVGITGTSSLIVQFRECINGNIDSLSAAVEHQEASSASGITQSTAVDTTTFGHTVTGGGTGAVWDGEQRIIFDKTRLAGGAGLKFSGPFNISRMISVPGSLARFMQLQMRVRYVSACGTANRCKVSVWLLGWS